MFYPETGSPEEWNAAYYRLEDYLRAHLVTNRIQQSQIILRLLQRAALKHRQHPQVPPLRLALEEAYGEMDAWFQQLILEKDLPAHRASALCRVSLYTLDAHQRWPDAFLDQDSVIPPDLLTAVRTITIQSGPDLAVSSMVPRPLDVTPEDEALEETWERLGRVSLAVLVGLVCLFIGAAVFYLSR